MSIQRKEFENLSEETLLHIHKHIVDSFCLKMCVYSCQCSYYTQCTVLYAFVHTVCGMHV